MWGNLHGWLISAVLAVLVLAPIGWVAHMSTISSVSELGADPHNLAAIVLPTDPDDAWPLFTEDSDAGPLYEQAVAAWTDDTDRAVAQFMASPQGQSPAPLKFLIDARHCQRMSLFSAHPAELINYDADHPRLEKLYSAGQWAWRIGLSLVKHNQPEVARPYLEAAFALGRQFYRDRLIFDEYQKGLQLMADSAASACQTVPRGSELFDHLTALQQAMSDYQEQHALPIWQVMGSVDQEVISRSAGDLLAFAQLSHDRMWRVEATLALGRYRFDAGTMGDQIGATRAVRQLSFDPDPAVAAAGKAACDLTIETYRMIH